MDLKTAVARYDKGTRMDIRRPLATWLDSLELARVRRGGGGDEVGSSCAQASGVLHFASRQIFI